MDLNYLKKILKIFDESTASELEISEEGVSIKISNNPPKVEGMPHYPMINMAPMQAIPQENVASASTPAPVKLEEESVPKEKLIDSSLHQITSPIVGTFYRSPSPDSSAYVEVGSKVKPGDVLCIVEAMKLMNEIECDVAGTIQEIVALNSQPVEYGQVMFLIKPE